MRRILAVGIATLDIIQEVAAYPAEDEELRAESARIQTGGNAANTLLVLAQLGHRCALAATLAGHPCGVLVRDRLAAYGIDLSPCVVDSAGLPPLSCVTVSRATGSRTIVHQRSLREYDFADFARVPLAGWDWIHFEGRHPPALRRMLARAAESGRARISLELEKPRPGLAPLAGSAAVLLCGRRYAEATGHREPEPFLEHLARHAPHARIYLAWGEGGAWVRDGGEIHHARARRPPVVVDTLGAGDCFNAAVIHGELRGQAPAEILARACDLAGRKCGQRGLDGLGAAPA